MSVEFALLFRSLPDRPPRAAPGETFANFIEPTFAFEREDFNPEIWARGYRFEVGCSIKGDSAAGWDARAQHSYLKLPHKQLSKSISSPPTFVFPTYHGEQAERQHPAISRPSQEKGLMSAFWCLRDRVRSWDEAASSG